MRSRELVASLGDLVVPLECAGCGQPRVRWCAHCARSVDSPPFAVRTRAELWVPVWAVARYGGRTARAVNGYKDRGREDLARPFGSALARAIDRLRADGLIPDAADRPLVLVPVPTSPRARRSRGFDHTRRLVGAVAADLAGGRPAEPVAVAPLLRIAGRVRDATGLDAGTRAANLEGRLRRRSRGVRVLASPGAPDSVEAILRGGVTVLLVDDVVTTGATLAACVAALGSGGVAVDGALCLLAA